MMEGVPGAIWTSIDEMESYCSLFVAGILRLIWFPVFHYLANQSIKLYLCIVKLHRSEPPQGDEMRMGVESWLHPSLRLRLFLFVEAERPGYSESP